ncbi:MAG: ATP-binding cassette domain-containing protein [Anaerococcus sp.]|uniref:ABC transporter ATP-binding protein n=1 Tax=Anaerococcus sp. TaxID=1872515 RepID=UPI0029007D32|nr:ATP-binding cassette domain-containing protein [Anaerococcus sp.]MDU2566085.1 ATP-binding cassette domain-containing protein [Anaerococcus sp.]
MIDVQNVSKSFGSLKALDNVSFTVEKGDVFGVIGQNGAGKSTLFRCMMNFFDDYTGAITYDGVNMKDIALEKIGFLPEERSLSPKKTIEEEIRYFAKLNFMDNIPKENLEKWFDRFEIKGKLTDKIKSLSKGNQQKVQLLAAVIYKPDFVILDEPLSGLDPYNIRLLEDIIKELNAMGMTILFSSHNMENVEALCNKLVMIKNGSIVLNGTPQEIRNSFPREKVVVETDKDLLPLIEGKVKNYIKKGDFWTIYLNNPSDSKEIYQLINDDIGFVSQFSQAAPSLNEIFAKVVESHE